VVERVIFEIKILLATSNSHKLDEILAVLPDDAPITWLTLGDLDKLIAEPVEDQPTFEGNSLLKARYYAQRNGLVTIADDSGLEVDALNGEPGVRSARYSGATGSRAVVDQANNKTLLEKLTHVSADQRSARFVCAMALAAPNGEKEIMVRGTVEGQIIGPDAQPCGNNGFGYDPLFYLPDRNQTIAQLSPQQKNAISHRGAATRLIWPQIQKWIFD
jgi:XTP/dITP diphosphohydrolase